MFCCSAAAHQLCTTASSSTPQGAGIKPPEAESSAPLAFLSPLPFPWLIPGSVQFFCVPQSVVRKWVGKGSVSSPRPPSPVPPPPCSSCLNRTISPLCLFCLLLLHQITVSRSRHKEMNISINNTFSFSSLRLRRSGGSDFTCCLWFCRTLESRAGGGDLQATWNFSHQQNQL